MLTIHEAAELIARPSQSILLRGDPDVRLAAMRIAVSALLSGETVFWVEGANRFDLYTLTEAAKKWGVDPHPLLRRIEIARAFTIYQIETIVNRTLPAALRRQPEAVAVISDPLALCWDDEVPYAEARRVVQRLAAAVRGLASSGFRLVVACPDPPAHNRERAGLLDLLRPAATKIINTAVPISGLPPCRGYGTVSFAVSSPCLRPDCSRDRQALAGGGQRWGVTMKECETLPPGPLPFVRPRYGRAKGDGVE